MMGVVVVAIENIRSTWSRSRSYSFESRGFGTGTGGGWEGFKSKCSWSCFMYVLFGVIFVLAFVLIGIYIYDCLWDRESGQGRELN